jgi:hypothetical protein
MMVSYQVQPVQVFLHNIPHSAVLFGAVILGARCPHDPPPMAAGLFPNARVRYANT